MIEQITTTEIRRTTEATMRMEHKIQPDIPLTLTQNTQTRQIPVVSEGTMSEPSQTTTAATNTDQTQTVTDSTQTPPQVPPKPVAQVPEELTSLIDTSSISKHTSLEFFSNKIMAPVTEEKYTKFEDLKKPTLHIAVPNGDATTKLHAELAELNLIPGSPPEIGYMPKMLDSKREQISEKIKKLEESHKDIVDIPSGGVQTLPPQLITKATETIVNQAFVSNNYFSQPGEIVNVPFTVPQHPIVQQEQILHQTSIQSSLLTPTEAIMMRSSTPTEMISVPSNIGNTLLQEQIMNTVNNSFGTSQQQQIVNQTPVSTPAAEVQSSTVWPPVSQPAQQIVNQTPLSTLIAEVPSSIVSQPVPVNSALQPQVQPQSTIQHTVHNQSSVSTTEIQSTIVWPPVTQPEPTPAVWQQQVQVPPQILQGAERNLPPVSQQENIQPSAVCHTTPLQPTPQAPTLQTPTPQAPPPINAEQIVLPPWQQSTTLQENTQTYQQNFVTTEPILRPQAYISEPEKQQNGFRSPSPRPSAEGVAMEKLWSSPKPHEKQFDSSVYHTSKNEFAEEKTIRKFSSFSESDTDYRYESASESEGQRRRGSIKETAKMFEEKIKDLENSPRHDYDLKAPGLVKQILPRPQHDRPKSVQESPLPDIYLEPGSPPEICYAPRTPAFDRKQSLVESFEQTLEKKLEKGPTKVLAGAVRMLPPTIQPSENKPIIPAKPVDYKPDGSFPFYSSCDERLFESKIIESRTTQQITENSSAPFYGVQPNEQTKVPDNKHKPKMVSGYMADTEDTTYNNTLTTANKENIETKRTFESYSKQTNVQHTTVQPSQSNEQPNLPNKHYRHFTHKHDQKDETFGQYEKVRLCDEFLLCCFCIVLRCCLANIYFLLLLICL